MHSSSAKSFALASAILLTSSVLLAPDFLSPVFIWPNMVEVFLVLVSAICEVLLWPVGGPEEGPEETAIDGTVVWFF